MNIKDITLMTIIGRDKESSRENLCLIEKIINLAKQNINFKHIKVLSAIDGSFQDDSINLIQISPMNSREYNRFCVQDLYKYVDTNYVLIFQTDGFVVNPNIWTDEFLDYDYIGAPWPNNFANRVGNGGFSLRSKKFIELTSTLEYIENIYPGGGITPEDYLVCSHYYEIMKKNHIKFAPLDLAIKFSYEQPIPEFPLWDHSMSLGFHGLFQGGGSMINGFRNNIITEFNIS